jgi:hypothetical protein
MKDPFQILTTVKVGTLTVKVSTVDLSLPEYGIVDKGYETALIIDADTVREAIEIVGSYHSINAAVEGHAAFMNGDVIQAILFRR